MVGEFVAALLQPLSRSEQAELFELMPKEAVTARPVDLAPGNLGEPATALIVIALTMTTLTALCAWLSTRGKNIKMAIKLRALGAVSEVQFEITSADTPEQVRELLHSRGIDIAK
jgi:hypothetical protein